MIVLRSVSVEIRISLADRVKFRGSTEHLYFRWNSNPPARNYHYWQSAQRSSIATGGWLNLTSRSIPPASLGGTTRPFRRNSDLWTKTRAIISKTESKLPTAAYHLILHLIQHGWLLFHNAIFSVRDGAAFPIATVIWPAITKPVRCLAQNHYLINTPARRRIFSTVQLRANSCKNKNLKDFVATSLFDSFRHSGNSPVRYKYPSSSSLFEKLIMSADYWENSASTYLPASFYEIHKTIHLHLLVKSGQTLYGIIQWTWYIQIHWA